MININKNILCIAIVFMSLSVSNSHADNKNTDKLVATPALKSFAKSNTVIPLRTLEKYLDRNLKTKILVGIDNANTEISVNLKKAPLNYSQLLTQLNINGFTAYRSDDYIQIIKVREAREYSAAIAEQNKTYLRDEYVTDFLKTEKSCTTKVLRTLSPLVPQYGHLSDYPNAHTIIIVDTYENIQRVKAALKKIEDQLSAPESCESVDYKL